MRLDSRHSPNAKPMSSDRLPILPKESRYHCFVHPLPYVQPFGADRRHPQARGSPHEDSVTLYQVAILSQLRLNPEESS